VAGKREEAFAGEDVPDAYARVCRAGISPGSDGIYDNTLHSFSVAPQDPPTDAFYKVPYTQCGVIRSRNCDASTRCDVFNTLLVPFQMVLAIRITLSWKFRRRDLYRRSCGSGGPIVERSHLYCPRRDKDEQATIPFFLSGTLDLHTHSRMAL